MAYDGQGIKPPALIAGADLSAKQFYFVKITANDTVNVCSAVTDIPYGVLQNKPLSGQEAEVMSYGTTKVSADAALTAGQLVGTSVDGQAAPYVAGTDTTKYGAGQVVHGVGAAGELATILLTPVARLA